MNQAVLALCKAMNQDGYWLVCSICDDEHIENSTTEVEAAEKLIKDGWKVVSQSTTPRAICPDCIKKVGTVPASPSNKVEE